MPATMIPQMSFRTLVTIDAGRFVWEEEPARYASAVLDSITGSRPGAHARRARTPWTQRTSQRRADPAEMSLS